MTNERRSAIPIDVYPDPVIAYTIEDGTALITSTNDAFDGVFDISTEMPVTKVFDQFAVVKPTGEKDPETHLARGDAEGIYLTGFDERGTYFARIVATDEDTGYLVFSELEEYLAVAETAGVGQVASVLSHDLRNPLDVAKAHLRAARETGEAEHFDVISSSHDRMEQIIRDVLMLARGHSTIDPVENISIQAAVEDAWQSVDTERATLNIPETLPTTTADPDRVRRLFENLIRNSIEHGSTDTGQPPDHETEPTSTESPTAVTITVGALEDGFYVADDGPGVSPDDQDAVFNPGYSTADRGTGLGLAIVEKIASAHGWDVTLTTAKGGGARFEVQF